MVLRLTKKAGQTWREAAVAQGARFGLESDVAASYDDFIANGTSEEWAAFDACSEWDVLDFIDDDGPGSVGSGQLSEVL